MLWTLEVSNQVEGQTNQQTKTAEISNQPRNFVEQVFKPNINKYINDNGDQRAVFVAELRYCFIKFPLEGLSWLLLRPPFQLRSLPQLHQFQLLLAGEAQFPPVSLQQPQYSFPHSQLPAMQSRYQARPYQIIDMISKEKKP